VRIDLRWQLLIATVCLVLVVSLLGTQLQTSGLCTTRVPSPGGRLTEGVIGRPERINPLFATKNPIEQDLVDLIFDGLTRVGDRGGIEASLAQDWEFDNDGRAISFKLRDDILWHDGTSFTAKDVIYTYSLLQSNDLEISPEQSIFWQSITISQSSDYGIRVDLPQAYSPILEAVTIGILPEHILSSVSAEELLEHPFNQQPIGTGPFLVAPGTDWHQSGILRLTPNPSQWRVGTMLDGLEQRFYTDIAEVKAAYLGGEIQAILTIPAEAISDISKLPGMRFFSAGRSRTTQMLFNLGDLGAIPLQNVDIRRALAYGIDRPTVIDRVLDGQGLPINGPYLPDSWASRPDLITDFHFSPDESARLLENEGWRIPEGSSIRSKENQTLSLRLVTLNHPVDVELAEAIAQYWSRIGIQTDIVSVESRELIDRLDSGNYDVALIEIDHPSDPDLYDLWSQDAIVRGHNYGRWNNRWASEALESARQLTAISDRKPYYEAFLRFFNEDLPALAMYQHVYTYGISDIVEEVEIGRIDSARDRYKNMSKWFIDFQDVSIACPEEST